MDVKFWDANRLVRSEKIRNIFLSALISSGLITWSLIGLDIFYCWVYLLVSPVNDLFRGSFAEYILLNITIGVCVTVITFLIMMSVGMLLIFPFYNSVLAPRSMLKSSLIGFWLGAFIMSIIMLMGNEIGSYWFYIGTLALGGIYGAVFMIALRWRTKKSLLAAGESGELGF